MEALALLCYLFCLCLDLIFECKGNAKVLNFASNLGALVLFIILGQVDFVYGLIMVVSMIIGSYVGAQFAISKGVGYVKILFIIVTKSSNFEKHI